MHVADLKMDTPFANVFTIIMVIRTKGADQNVRVIQTVQWAKHVFETNVKIHVSEYAVVKQSVRYQITFRFALAHREQLEMHSDSVLWLFSMKNR